MDVTLSSVVASTLGWTVGMAALCALAAVVLGSPALVVGMVTVGGAIGLVIGGTLNTARVLQQRAGEHD